VSMGNLTYGDVLAGRAREEDLRPFGGDHAHKAFALAAGLQLLVDALAPGDGFGAVLLLARPEADPVPAFRALAADLPLRGNPDARASRPRGHCAGNAGSPASQEEWTMKKLLEIGGFISGAILIAFGVAVIALGVDGRSTVTSSLKQEKITGSEDMTPALIKQEAAKAGLTNVSLPSCSVAGKAINSGDRARCFAQYMRIHALESSGGLT